MLIELLWFAVLGAGAGLLSGLLGIGGGLLIVPGLAYIFSFFVHMPSTYVMHFAAGTSLAIMVVTGIFSAAAHYRHGHVKWDIAWQLIPGSILGVVVGAVIAHYLPSKILSLLFSFFVFFVAIRMLMLVPPKSGRTLPTHFWVFALALLIGLKSGVLGIGGGALIIPFLVRCNVPMRNASGTSSVCSWFIAVAGTIAFYFTGASSAEPVTHAWGYIYLPGFVAVAITGSIFAPVGALLTTKVPVDTLKRIFGGLLVIIAIDMFIKGI